MPVLPRYIELWDILGGICEQTLHWSDHISQIKSIFIWLKNPNNYWNVTKTWTANGQTNWYQMSHFMRKLTLSKYKQQRHRSAYIFMQSDQHLCCLLPRQYNIYICLTKALIAKLLFAVAQCMDVQMYFTFQYSLNYMYIAGLGGSVGCAVRLEIRRSRVQPPSRSATFFRGDWSWNIFYGHSLPSADSRRAVVSFWRKNVHNTG